MITKCLKTLFLVSIALFFAACGQNNANQADNQSQSGNPGLMAPAQSSEAYVLYPDLPLWKDDNGNAKWLESLTLGDKIELLGQTKKLTQDKSEREYVLVRAVSGKEGWVRPNLLAGNAQLGVVKAEGAVIYSEARDVKLTSQSISPRNLVAISQDGASGGFVKVSAWDLGKSQIYTDVFVNDSDLTKAPEDINAIILLTVAKSTKNPDSRKALLNTALTKYGSSMFTPDIEAELQAMESGATAPAAQ